MAQLKTTNVHGDLHVSGDITQEGNKVYHTGNILKTTGNNDEFPMSQKAVTDALNNLPSLGVGQTWQNVAASRNLRTVYTNTTGRPIFVSVSCVIPDNIEPAYLLLEVQGEVISGNGVEYIMPDSPGLVVTVQGIIPAGSTYEAYGPNQFIDLIWKELR